MSDVKPRSIRSVLIVEDHKDAANILASIITEAFGQPELKINSTLASGLESLRQAPFDMALLDLGLPDGNGLDLVRYAGAHCRHMLTIVTTIFDDEENLFEALRAGAHGYLLKGHSPVELEMYLQDAVAGRPALSPSIAHSMLEYFRSSTAKQDNEVGLEELTGRERDVLTLIAKGYGVREVAELLEISTNTVSHHVKNLYSKLNVHNRAEATAAAVKLNIFNPDN